MFQGCTYTNGRNRPFGQFIASLSRAPGAVAFSLATWAFQKRTWREPSKRTPEKKKKHTQTHLGLALFGTCSRLLTGLPQRVGAEVKARKAWCLLGSSIAKAGIFIPWRHTLCALSPSYCGRTKPQHPKRCALLLTKCPKKRTTATSLDASRNLYWLLP